MYVQRNKFFLSDAFKIFWNMFHEICELNPACLFPAPGLAWQAALKKAKVKLGFLNYIDLLMVEGITAGICHAIHWYAKANNK